MNDNAGHENNFLKLFVSNSTLASNLNIKCMLKQLASVFGLVRIFVSADETVVENYNYGNQNSVEQTECQKVVLKENESICSCGIRLLLAKYNILIKSTCQRFRFYCADQIEAPEDDCL